ncbi:hypothetical protein K438DRAFT_1863095 [Mycena galopus ATCC 62051]|nr:hypothetical protein K438DRAFT_1863095 [Mycena galopus ATCC 62051]
MSAVLPDFSFATTAEEVATALSAEIRGKNVLITGTSINGIGFETARVIARHANLVIITGYNQESVRKAAAEINVLPEPLHVLINNAAAILIDFALTPEGLETQYATNHVGPFLFTKLLAPKLLVSASPSYTPRVVFVSSVAQALGKGVDFEMLETPDPAKYSTREVYRGTKSANILTAIELSKRSKGKINAYSLHPGAIFTNAFKKEAVITIFKADGGLKEDGQPNMAAYNWKTIPQGAATTVTAAFDPRLNDKAGGYLDDCAVANDRVAPHNSDPMIAEKLWNITEKIIGENFSF